MGRRTGRGRGGGAGGPGEVGAAEERLAVIGEGEEEGGEGHL